MIHLRHVKARQGKQTEMLMASKSKVGFIGRLGTVESPSCALNLGDSPSPKKKQTRQGFSLFFILYVTVVTWWHGESDP